MSTNRDVDDYVARSDRWPDEISALRPVLVGSGLVEEIKWSKPCYTHGGRNILILQEMKDFLAVMFFKGALLTDPDGVLEAQGPNSRSARRMRITSVDDVARLADALTTAVAEAIDVEDSGREVEPAPALVLVEELQMRLGADPALRASFEALTPGRQREYHLHISSAKRTATRMSRIDACTPKILAGKGLRDR